jgi:UPF0755 protein
MLKKLLGWSFVTLLFCGILHLYKIVYISSLNNSEEPYNIYIKKHDTFANVIANLDAKANLSSKNAAILYGNILGIGKSLFVGEYKIPPNASLREVLTKFATGDVVVHKFTIIEGWNSYQLMDALDKEQNLVHVLNHNLGKSNMPNINGELEGAYFPDTYFYAYPDTDLDILKRANEKMTNILHVEYQHKKNNIELNSEYEALIIASLLEKEALDNSEKYTISGIIQNRIKRGMRLQIDAAVYYGLVYQAAGEIDRMLSSHDIKNKANVYNTYAYKGLPPGPIAMPSLAAIRAACNPSYNEYLYYVVKNDYSNTHHFSLNFKEHKMAIKKYLHN